MERFGRGSHRPQPMPHVPQRLDELKEMIAAAETSVALLTWVIERRASVGRNATRLRALVQSTQKRLAELIARRKQFLEDEASD
jgi:hypothetical protein